MAKRTIIPESNPDSKDFGLKKVWYHKSTFHKKNPKKSYDKQYNRFIKTNVRRNYRRQFDKTRFTDRTYLNATSSSYYYDFAYDNRKKFFTIFLLFIGMFIVIMIDDVNVETVNPLESGVNILKAISNSGHNLKDAGLNFVKSFTTWTDPDSSYFNTPEWLQGFLGGVKFKGNAFGLIDSISYSAKAIWFFLRSIFSLIVTIFKILMGAY